MINAKPHKLFMGQSLFEVVVAIAISALIISTIVALVTNSIRNSTFSKNESAASTYAQQLTEWLRGQRDSSISDLLANVSTESPNNGSSTWCFPVLSWGLPSRATYGGTPICTEGNDEISTTPFLRSAVFSISHPEPSDGSGRLLTVIKVDITVFWRDSQGEHKVTNSTYFSDFRQR